MIKTKLAKAVSMAVAGVALSAGATTASAHVMYNTFTTTSASSTDGWTRVNDIGSTNSTTGVYTPPDGIFTGPESKGNSGNLVPWVGTAGGALPFGYAGSSHLNWAAHLHSAGSSLTVSAADALADYGVAAEIDTGAGAWLDAGGVSSTGAPIAPTGWRHQTDIGLIKSDVTQKVTINLSTLGSFNNNFGVTVFTGMDTNTGNYSHHGSWNCPTCATPKPLTASNPFGTSGLAYLTHDESVDALNGLTFTAVAGQIYSIYLGGNGVGRWSQNVAGYSMDITTSAVPVPGAVWLFGSAMVGLIGFGGRRKAAVAA
ncbi:PEP-CTERM sorting domain-containing protein [Methylomonas methanica]|nr:PEP-CTERM sorting domain-containing protein [Methylomonas methanica]